jgi:creatinine amidohydrolase
MSRALVELSGPAVAATLTADSIIVLPTGAVEHHGAHLPLSTDLLMAESLGTATVEAAAAAGLDTWVLPALGYTKSDEHAWAPGTMWLSYDTLMHVVIDLGRSVASTPAKTLVFYNGHGGNVALLQVALRELRRQFGLRTFLMGGAIPAGDGVNGPDERGFGIHGGHSETSVVMHLRPELVDLSLAKRAVPDHLADFTRLGFNGFPAQFGWTSDDFGTGGVIGDPTGATAEWGATLTAKIIADGVTTLTEISRFRHEPPHSH